MSYICSFVKNYTRSFSFSEAAMTSRTGNAVGLSRAARGEGRAGLVGICAVLALVAAIPVWLAVETVRDRQALEADWTFRGPPCPAGRQPR